MAVFPAESLATDAKAPLAPMTSAESRRLDLLIAGSLIGPPSWIRRTLSPVVMLQRVMVPSRLPVAARSAAGLAVTAKRRLLPSSS